MATFSTTELIGAKEDIDSYITRIDQEETTFASSIGSKPITQRKHGWQEQAIAAAGLNAQVEGADSVTKTVIPTVYRENNTQILSQAIGISASAEATESYGRGSEAVYQVMLAGLELRKALNFSNVGNGQVASMSANRTFASVQAQIDPTCYTYTGSTTGQPNPLSETAHYLPALQACTNRGAKPKVTVVTTDNAITFAGFAYSAGRFRDFKDSTTLVNTIDVYKSPFGTLKIVMDYQLKAGDTLLIDYAKWHQLVFRKWTKEALAKTGDSDKVLLVGEFSLQHDNRFAGQVIRAGTAPT